MTDQFPEHERLSAVSEISNQIGQFLDWMGEQGIHRMIWFDSEEVEVCFDCDQGFKTIQFGRNKGNKIRCTTCGGLGERTVSVKRWQREERNIQQLLADYFEIDLKKLAEEKDEMLNQIRQANAQ